MAERVVFADTEKAIVDFLAAELAAVSDIAEVVTQVPDIRPPRMVRVTRDDRRARLDREDREGRRGAHLILDRPRMVFECTDDSGTAAGLASLVRSIITAAAPGYVGATWCDAVEDAGLENDTDPATDRPRYVFVADMYVRGETLA
ncbi:hypothetical protein ACWCW7_17715 [Nocardia tengchongensis]